MAHNEDEEDSAEAFYRLIEPANHKNDNIRHSKFNEKEPETLKIFFDDIGAKEKVPYHNSSLKRNIDNLKRFNIKKLLIKNSL